MKIEQLMTMIFYGAELVRPNGISTGRWNAMINLAKKDLKSFEKK